MTDHTTKSSYVIGPSSVLLITFLLVTEVQRGVRTGELVRSKLMDTLVLRTSIDLQESTSKPPKQLYLELYEVKYLNREGTEVLRNYSDLPNTVCSATDMRSELSTQTPRH